MSNSEIAELVSKREGRVCARMFRRADGKIITKDCPRGAFRTRMKFAGAALIAAICLVFSLAKADKLGFLQSKSDLVRAFKSMYSAGDDYVMGEAE